MLYVLIDNGHGDPPLSGGKHSPDRKLKEYYWARDVARMIASDLNAMDSINATLITPEITDTKLGERTRRVNALCAKHGAKNCICISVHVNAADSDGCWHTASGWSVMVAPNASGASKRLAQTLYAEAERRGLRGNRCVPKERYWVQNLAICRDTACPAVLTENLFMDNRAECQWLLTDEGKKAIAALHVKAICDYAKTLAK